MTVNAADQTLQDFEYEYDIDRLLQEMLEVAEANLGAAVVGK